MLTRSITVAAVRAEPVRFDREATTDKEIHVVGEVTRGGARLTPEGGGSAWIYGPEGGSPAAPLEPVGSPSVEEVPA